MLTPMTLFQVRDEMRNEMVEFEMRWWIMRWDGWLWIIVSIFSLLFYLILLTYHHLPSHNLQYHLSSHLLSSHLIVITQMQAWSFSSNGEYKSTNYRSCVNPIYSDYLNGLSMILIIITSILLLFELIRFFTICHRFKQSYQVNLKMRRREKKRW